MKRDFRILTVCCASIIAALLVVGAVSHGVVRHIVQTSPLWIAIVFSLRGSGWSKWVALPCFFFWLLLMTAIWLFLLGWVRIVSGTFSSTEIAMTLIVGLASITGIVRALGLKSGIHVGWGTGALLLVGALQVMALRLSFLPLVANR